ncbi:MAG TPA: 50S ribosomal protein L22 [Candidatus Paceibacterota bacterium]
MTKATAQLSNYRQSPRKVGLVAGLVRGKRVDEALAVLDMMPKRAALPVAKLIKSAVANAQSQGMMKDDLVISKVTVDKGIVFKRSVPRARGSMALIRKKASHIKLELSAAAAPKAPAKKVAAKKPAKKVAAKK